MPTTSDTSAIRDDCSPSGDRRRQQSMQPWRGDFAGTFHDHTIDSEALRGNPLGDPAERPLWVYTPPGYGTSDARYPTIYVIQGLTGAVDMWWNRKAFRPTFPELTDRLF